MTKTMELFLQMRDMGLSIDCVALDKMLAQELKSNMEMKLDYLQNHLESVIMQEYKENPNYASALAEVKRFLRRNTENII